MFILKLIKKIGESTNNDYSDIIIKEWFNQIWVKINWKIKFMEIENIIENTYIREYINDIIPSWYEKLQKNQSLDLWTKIENIKLRINITYSNWKILIIIRKLNNNIIPINKLWINDLFLEKIKKADKWLFVISWRTWSGKSTTLSSLVDYFNVNYQKHIITLENPIETEFKNIKSFINQKELFKDFLNYESAMEDLLREAPDIIMIWEIRNKEVLKKALEIANSWHLVLWTIHGNNTTSVIWKMIRSSENEKEIANELSDTLIWILHQESIYYNWKFVLIIETLYNNSKVRAWLLNWKYNWLKSIIQTSGNDWMITLEQYLEKELYEKGIIDVNTFKNLYEKYNNLWIN